jgi:undecaprenyl-phosphate 4-deoxy-4-formamido-L-arabinose transferase
MEAGPFRLSVVIPVYNGASTIGPLVGRLLAELRASYALEIVLVEDGSGDDSAAACRALAEQHPEVVFVGLARNFGDTTRDGRAARVGGQWSRWTTTSRTPQEVARLVETRTGFDVVFARGHGNNTRRSGMWAAGSTARSPQARQAHDLYLSRVVQA